MSHKRCSTADNEDVDVGVLQSGCSTADNEDVDVGVLQSRMGNVVQYLEMDFREIEFTYF